MKFFPSKLAACPIRPAARVGAGRHLQEQRQVPPEIGPLDVDRVVRAAAEPELMDGHQPLQLVDRARVIVRPQVDVAVALSLKAAAGAND